ncbi:MAG: sugar ABC transporter ATP-binding protein [Erysipelotrichaceae bacterium]|nr:sugar ABC transporter ATP-binding protein [Erysipelotrichaceae bacterium]
MTENTVLRFDGISKRFPGVQALDHVSFSLNKGEVLALVGENGAGKSTLVKCLTGANVPDEGTIEVLGQKFTKIDPLKINSLGISAVYQEFNLVPDLPVCENVFMGKNPGHGIFVDYKEMLKRTSEIFEEFGVPIDPKADVRTLSLAEMQLVEIAKAVSSDVKILILDEPTAPLTNRETEVLFNIVRQAKAKGVSIIYISHRLEEIFEICDRCVVMRDGKYVDTQYIKDITRQDMIRMMLGHDLTNYYPEKETLRTDEVVLETEHLYGNGVKDANIKLYKGEILGFAGLVGAGRTELMNLLFAAVKRDSGTIRLFGNEFNGKHPWDAINAGIALLPEDRKRLGLLMDKTIAVNVTLASLKKLSRFGFINEKKEREDVERYREQLQIKTPTIEKETRQLSGGNQQKVIVAKWLESESDIVIFDEPTQGIDVGTKHEIYMIIDQLVETGHSVIVVSSDLEELMGIADRMYVMSEGEIMGELERNQFNKEVILDLASGRN